MVFESKEQEKEKEIEVAKKLEQLRDDDDIVAATR